MKLLHAASDSGSSSKDNKEEKVANQTEQQILDIETQIENKESSIPEDPKAALLVKKAITDLKGRILTLKGSIPEKKTESGVKILLVKAAGEWWDKMSEAQKKAYTKKHPGSKNSGKGVLNKPARMDIPALKKK